jgi:hypothetical protein
MLSSNIEIQNTVIDIENSIESIVSVYLHKETGYLSILGIPNSITGQFSSIKKLCIRKKFNQSIIIPDNLEYLDIDGEFNQPIILPEIVLEFFLLMENSTNQLSYQIILKNFLLD